MAAVKINICKITSRSFPGFVKFELIDCNGKSHIFHDKIPIVSSNDDLTPPCSGSMRCVIAEIKEKTYIIDTSMPDDIESENGDYQFEVYKNQVTISR